MNLQKIMRVAVCAAVVALLIAGAGLFPARPVAGKETRSNSLRGAAALDQLKRDGQCDSLQAAMNQERFSVSRAEHTPLGRPAWRAPNPAAGYDAYITEEGVSIATNDKTYVSLSLSSLGYGQAVRSVAPGKVGGDKQTIDIEREDSVHEWYVNGPEGLEHGFTLSEPPGGAGAQSQGAPLRLTLQVSKDWRAVAGEDGQRVILRGGGQVVEYGKLVVRDSHGRNIPARLAVAEGQVVIEVEDSEAAYPLTIDPIFSLQRKLLAADGTAGSFFGDAVALDGDTLVVGAMKDNVGANQEQGSAYVFARSGSTWTLQQKLSANDGAAGDHFGSSVALEGDVMVVGAPSYIGANSGQGSVYVFARSGSTWTLQEKLSAYDGLAGDFFGRSVALDGDTLVVGAQLDDIGANIDQGSAYVFARSGSTWIPQPKLIANDGAAGDRFGIAVAVDGDSLAVGAKDDSIDANWRQGSAYVFTRGGAAWTQQQKLVAADGEAGAEFGASIAIEGNTLVTGSIGVAGPAAGANWGQGAVYVFTNDGVTWTQQQKLIANDGATEDGFGYAVALDDDLLVIGALLDTIGPNWGQGSTYVFTRSGATWTQQQKLIATDGADSDRFGSAVAVSGHTFAVGSSWDDVDSNQDQGSVYVFYRPPCEALALTPASLPNGSVYSDYNQLVSVNSAGLYQFAISNGALPPGLLLSSGGALSGVPTMLGVYQFTITATDLTSPCYISRDYTLTIDSCQPLTIDPPTLLRGMKGLPYNEPLTATGGVGPYVFSKKSGQFPPGLRISAGGVISGTPTRTGNFSFTVEARDSNGCTGTADYSIAITVPGIEFSRSPDAKRGVR